jgi:hypothetical protein
LLFSAELSRAAFSTSHTYESDNSASAPSVPAAKELVFIDTRVSDHQTIVDSLQNQTQAGGNLEIVILAPTVDNIQQISEALAGRRQLQAIHIVSHGSDGAIELGSTTLDADSLERNAEAVSRWANSLAADGDLLVYGCNVAQTETGRGLLYRLSQLTGADVGASDDPTGSAKFGGNWDLEFRTGAIETPVVLSSQAQQRWNGLLDVTTGLTGHWKFDANANDFSGNSYNGTLTNGAAIDTTAATNRVGPGKLFLDGTNDFVDLTAHRANFTGLSQGTVAA